MFHNIFLIATIVITLVLALILKITPSVLSVQDAAALFCVAVACFAAAFLPLP